MTYYRAYELYSTQSHLKKIVKLIVEYISRNKSCLLALQRKTTV